MGHPFIIDHLQENHTLDLTDLLCLWEFMFEGSGNAAQAARAALLPNTFLQALVCRALTGPILPEVIEE